MHGYQHHYYTRRHGLFSLADDDDDDDDDLWLFVVIPAAETVSSRVGEGKLEMLPGMARTLFINAMRWTGRGFVVWPSGRSLRVRAGVRAHARCFEVELVNLPTTWRLLDFLAGCIPPFGGVEQEGIGDVSLGYC